MNINVILCYHNY